mmetsp:Transcript_2842/g.6217  ORF Transcript_2842/g.6217 Transcript_2842/m.6217 type:complete len:164 (-) Transcript_2842:113-604(-)
MMEITYLLWKCCADKQGVGGGIMVGIGFSFVGLRRCLCALITKSVSVGPKWRDSFLEMLDFSACSSAVVSQRSEAEGMLTLASAQDNPAIILRGDFEDDDEELSEEEEPEPQSSHQDVLHLPAAIRFRLSPLTPGPPCALEVVRKRWELAEANIAAASLPMWQ